jgi:two-component system sensor histidine kinase/response regulator
MRRYLANRQWTDLTRLAHSFKGLSATIGAENLRSLGERIEYGSVSSSPALSALLSELEELLGTTLEALRCYLHLGQKEGALGAAAALESTGDSRELLETLRFLLSESDSAVLDFWTVNEAQLNNLLPSHTAKRIAQAISTFQFAEALALLTSSQDR